MSSGSFEIVSTKLWIAITLVAVVSSVHFTQAYGLATFAMRVGGPGTDDVWRSIEPSFDGGYIIAGNTDSFGSGKNDAWIIKLSEDGEIVSQKTYGGKGGDTSRTVRQTADGGYVVAGMTNSFSNGRSDVWVLKFASDGKMEWHKGYGSSNHEMAHSIEPTADGGYLVGGYTTSFGAVFKDYFVIKIDAGGMLQWAKRYGGAGDDVIRIVKQISNGDYLIAGFTHSFGTNGDILILRIDGDGDIVWQKRYGGGKFEEPSTILEMPDGYIIMEQSTSFSKNTDGWIFKINDAGGMVWQKTIGGNSFDEISAAQVAEDGGFIVAAETKSFGAVNEDFWVVKFDADGDPEWQKRYGGAGIDEPEAIALTPEGGSIVVGTTRSFDSVGMDVWFLRLNAAGDVLQCSSGVTANLPTAAKVGTSTANPVNTIASQISVTPLVKAGAVLPGKNSTASISYQCGVDVFNMPPVAVNDSYTTDEDIALNVPAPGVLGNDTDLEAQTLAAVLEDAPENGTVLVNSDGSFAYTPNANYSGSDSFTYKANDGSDDSNLGTVTITVNAVNDMPVAVEDAYAASEDVPLLIVPGVGVLANDLDTEADGLSALLVSDVEHGDLTLDADGGFTYTPSPNYNGSDFFTYSASDGTSTSIPATVLIAVGGSNDPPVAIDDVYFANEDEPLNVAADGILMNDTDTENDSLTATVVDGTQDGKLIFKADGSFTYTPDADFAGEDYFTYKVNDGFADSNTATVSIIVNPVNDAPFAVGDSYSTDDDTPLIASGIGILANDTDIDTGPSNLTVIEVSEPSSSFALNANGSFIFTPDDGDFREFIFVYRVFDGAAESDMVEVRITVEERDI